jgi:hypothetical protein
MENQDYATHHKDRETVLPRPGTQVTQWHEEAFRKKTEHTQPSFTKYRIQVACHKDDVTMLGVKINQKYDI